MPFLPQNRTSTIPPFFHGRHGKINGRSHAAGTVSTTMFTTRRRPTAVLRIGEPNRVSRSLVAVASGLVVVVVVVVIV